MPAFVKELVIATRLADPGTRFSVLAPHDHRARTRDFTRHEHYDEYRFRYAWPSRLQTLAGEGGIGPSLKNNRALLALVPFFLLGEAVALLRLTRLLRPDVINAHWIIPQGVVAAITRLFARRPLVLTIHGGDVFTFNAAPARSLKRWAMRSADRILVNSSVTQTTAQELYPGGSYSVIPMGVDLASFEGRDSAGHPELRVLFVGRLSEEKGVADLIAALEILQHSGIEFEARIAGTGPQADELADLVHDAGLESSVTFLGWVAHATVAEHYRWADVFVGPSIASDTGWVEALGVVFIEASAAGLPVITTNTGGMRDVIVHERTGYIVPEKTPQAIAEKLVRLAGDRELASRLGAAGVEHVAASFSWPTIAARYAQVFRSL